MNVTTKIQKCGNSFQITPKKRKSTLEELMAKITPENQHDEIDWGSPQGKEI